MTKAHNGHAECETHVHTLYCIVKYNHKRNG